MADADDDDVVLDGGGVAVTVFRLVDDAVDAIRRWAVAGARGAEILEDGNGVDGDEKAPTTVVVVAIIIIVVVVVVVVVAARMAIATVVVIFFFFVDFRFLCITIYLVCMVPAGVVLMPSARLESLRR